MRSYEAYNPQGRLVRTFNAPDLAERYKADMQKIGMAVTLKIVRLERRAVAA